MFNHTEHSVKANADNPSSAVAHLLTNRKGAWFIFDSETLGGNKYKKQAIHTSLITSFSQDRIRTADGKYYDISQNTYERLLVIMEDLEGLADVGKNPESEN